MVKLFLNLFSFNPRSREGNDSISSRSSFAIESFNPRSREGNDDWRGGGTSGQRHVSIHVPARGTTVEPGTETLSITFQSTFPRGERHDGISYILMLRRFQSTFPRGERRRIPGGGTYAIKFQSTFPRGERRAGIRTIPMRISCFNPRSREGNDT